MVCILNRTSNVHAVSFRIFTHLSSLACNVRGFTHPLVINHETCTKIDTCKPLYLIRLRNIKLKIVQLILQVHHSETLSHSGIIDWSKIMSQQQILPAAVSNQLTKLVKQIVQKPNDRQLSFSLKSALGTITTFISATSSTLLQYNGLTKHSTVISEFNGTQTGYLERSSDIGEIYDERQYRTLYPWLESKPTYPITMHFDQLLVDSIEHREFQKYGVMTVVYAPIYTIGNGFWGYLELWESRYTRCYSKEELTALRIAGRHLSFIISSEAFTNHYS